MNRLTDLLKYPIFGHIELDRRARLLEAATKTYLLAALLVALITVTLFPDNLGRLIFVPPGFYVTQSRKERWKFENPLFLRKMEQFRPIFHHFYAKIAMLGRIGKGSNERFAGSDFHPVGERNVAGGSHVKILNP